MQSLFRTQGRVRFLEEAEIGHKVDNLEFWLPVASVRLMPDSAIILPEWQLLGNMEATESSARQGLRRLVASIIRKIEK